MKKTNNNSPKEKFLAGKFKTFKITFLALMLGLCSSGFATTTQVNDVGFEDYLETHDALGNIVVLGASNSMGNGIANDNDNLILTSRIVNLKKVELSLSVASSVVSNTEVLKHFTNLETLIVNGYDSRIYGGLYSLHVPSKVKLLSLQGTEYSDIISWGPLALKTLYVSNFCSSTQALDPSFLTPYVNLTHLNIYSINTISNLPIDYSKCTKLTNLFLVSSSANFIDLSKNILLDTIHIDTYGLISLDLSANINLEYAKIETFFRGQFEFINLKNGNNTNLDLILSTNYLKLMCIQVDNVAYSNANWTTKPSRTSYSTDCHYGETYVPDNNFEAYLETHNAAGVVVPLGDVTSMGNGIANDDYVFERNINGVTNLHLPHLNIKDFTGIEGFVMLQKLIASYNPVSTYDFTQNTQLKELHAEKVGFTSLDITKNILLETLTINRNLINRIDLTKNTKLKSLNCSKNNLTNLDLSKNTLLEVLNCGENNFTILDISTNTSLTSFHCYLHKLTSLNFTNHKYLKTLHCDFGKLSSLNVNSCYALEDLNCQSNELETLDLTNCSELNTLYCDHNKLERLNYKNNNNTKMNDFVAVNNPNLLCIEVDNAAYSTANWTDIDPASTFGDNCYFTVVKGEISYDKLNNGCASGTTTPAYLTVKATVTPSNRVYYTYTDASGNYEFKFNEPTSGSIATIECSTSNIAATPINYVKTLAAGQTFVNQDFCIKSTATGKDVSVIVIPTSDARPGYNSTYRIIYQNLGNAIILGGSIRMFFDDMKIHDPQSITAFSQSGDKLTWNYTNLNPFETKTIDIQFTVNTPQATNPVRGGEILVFNMDITPLTSDINQSNNTFTLKQTVVNSYDPNDAVVLEGSTITPTQALTDLNFRIRFQNTGTASALNIKVKTELDAFLDWSTFKPVASSHTYKTAVTAGNRINFIFDNINLADSFTDEKSSHGWILFKAKPKSTFAKGDIIKCKADIFFDFNDAIITNTATTEIKEKVGMAYIKKLIFSIYPNPAKEKLTIKIASKGFYSLKSVNGQVIKSGELRNGNNTIDLSDIKGGFYYIKVKSALGSGVKKMIVNL